MAITLRELYNETHDRFQISCLACEDKMDHVVSWVHMVELSNLVSFFWGNELVVSSCYTSRTTEEMLNLVNTLDMKNCTGLVINIGAYVEKIPQEVIDRCEELALPLLTMPWEFKMSDLVKYCCGRIDQSAHDNEELSQAAIRAFLSPRDTGDYYTRLANYFDEEGGFQILSVYLDVSEQTRRLGLHITELRFHTALQKWAFQYLVFPYGSRFVLIMNQTDPAVTEEIVQSLLNAYHATYRTRKPDMRINIGIGQPVEEIAKLYLAYQTALAAVRQATLTNADVVNFKDMGFYRMLYSISSDKLMIDYYNELLAPLLEYDQKHGASYKETLFRYLLHNGSLQAVAEDMYTHRNTVNYRMGRIRELLNCSLSTHSECLPYLLAYHIGVILRIVTDYQI